MAEGLFEQLEKIKKQGKGLPPVHLWNPERVYDIDIRIDMEGRWFHEGGEIKRLALIKLFASVLKKEDESYFLVTPVEKARIQVDDVPFLIVEMEVDRKKSGIVFRTNLDELVSLSATHPVVLREGLNGQSLPYVAVRDGLLARLNRNVYYQAIELAIEKDGKFYLSSEGDEFCIGSL